MTTDQLTAHFAVDRYGDFRLTDAIRPSINLQVVPREGYRIELFRDRRAGVNIPVLAASVSAEKLFETFVDLLEPLGDSVDVVLESSHQSAEGEHRDLIREQIDRPVLLSNLYDFEEMLLNDGCTGLAVIAQGRALEVQFDEHKLLLVYGRDLRPFERALRAHGVNRDDRLKLITEGEHLHSTERTYEEAFEQLGCRLGVGELAGWVNG